MSYTDEERARIGRVVQRQREDLGWGKEEAARHSGISSITWKRIEDGLRVQGTKMRRAEAALGWSIGSLDQVARGRPAIVDPSASMPAWGELKDEDELWRGFKEATVFAEVCRRRGANDEMCRYFIADALALLNSAASSGSDVVSDNIGPPPTNDPDAEKHRGPKQSDDDASEELA